MEENFRKMSRNGHFAGTFSVSGASKEAGPKGGTTDCACVNAACNGEAVGRLWVRLRCSTESEGLFRDPLYLGSSYCVVCRGRLRGVVPGVINWG